VINDRGVAVVKNIQVKPTEQTKQLIPVNPSQLPVTRVPKFATELPFFYLTKQKQLLTQVIEYQGVDEAGRPIRWKVTPNLHPDIGAPAIEAHEIWYRLIRPAMEAAIKQQGKLPSVIPLGGIRESLRKVGWSEGGRQARDLLQAIRQISSAWCSADFWLPTKELDEAGQALFKLIKGEFNRMSIYAIGSKHITDEELQEGRFSFDFNLDDMLYIQLHPLEVAMQQNQLEQPTDNEYLFSVNPAARRWYELLAPKIFGVVKNKGAYCEIRYSWYIKHHTTLKRWHERYRVVEQMNELIKDHKAFSYISKVEYTKVKEPDQETDFIIRYYPGEGAKESIARIQGHTYKKKLASSPAKEKQQLEQGRVDQPTLETLAPTLTEEEKQLIRKLNTEFEIAITTAHQLVKGSPEAVKVQLGYWPYRTVKYQSKAGWMITAIKENYGPPSNFQERQIQEEARQQQRTQTAKRESQKRAYEQYRSDTIDNYIQEHAGEYEAILQTLMNRLRKTEPNPLMQGMARNEISQRIELLTYETYCAGKPQPPSDPTNNTPLEAQELTQERRIDEQGSATPPQITTTIQEPPAHATELQEQPHHNTLPAHLL
jgi:hypothetical protein